MARREWCASFSGGFAAWGKKAKIPRLDKNPNSCLGLKDRPVSPSTSLDQPTAATTTRTAAVIDIGATAIRMAIAEIDGSGGTRLLETVSQGVNLGKDTFARGAIRRSTIEDCVKVLESYRQLLREYQVTHADQIRVIATSAVREASNRLAFIDRVYIATGLTVEPLDEAEVNRITFVGIKPYLDSEPSLATAKTLVIEVGGGSTEVLLVQNGKVVYSHAYRLGSLRLREMLEEHRLPKLKVRSIMQSQIGHTVEEIVMHVPSEGSTELIALGGDIRFAASQLLPEKKLQNLGRVSTASLERFTDKILELTTDEIVQKYQIPFPDAETLGPALLAYSLLSRTLRLDHLLVTNVNLRNGLLKEMAARNAWSEDFSEQVIHAALDFGRKFCFDEQHATHVALLAKKLFEQLREQHQLDDRSGMLLHVAALLHEIGLYVNTTSYHKHSMYLIQNGELFGLTRRDHLLVALVARYHRRASPKPTHPGYAALDRDSRVIVCKLAAILRIAIALDRSYNQRIRDFRCEQDDDHLMIAVPHADDLSLEQLALRQNGSLFEETFGLQVVLQATQG
jgi:exopolyphosphatase/guanosine-5'-triphosphate,3'-diphosphate pyrophosphatase